MAVRVTAGLERHRSALGYSSQSRTRVAPRTTAHFTIAVRSRSSWWIAPSATASPSNDSPDGQAASRARSSASSSGMGAGGKAANSWLRVANRAQRVSTPHHWPGVGLPRQPARGQRARRGQHRGGRRIAEPGIKRPPARPIGGVPNESQRREIEAEVGRQGRDDPGLSDADSAAVELRPAGQRWESGVVLERDRAHTSSAAHNVVALIKGTNRAFGSQPKALHITQAPCLPGYGWPFYRGAGGQEPITDAPHTTGPFLVNLPCAAHPPWGGGLR